MKMPYKLLIAVALLFIGLYLLRYIFGFGTIIGSLLIGVVIGYFIGKKYS
jgi:hypothetical protein